MTDKKFIYRPINWNVIPDMKDKEIWEKLTSNFWIDTRFPISNDRDSWRTLTEDEKWLVMRVFTGLTTLDTLQGEFGAVEMIPDAITEHEKAWLLNIAFMEAVHAKSYSTIFQTLADNREIERAFRWAEENPYLQKKAEIVLSYYQGEDPLKRKIASTFLESFLFYSGFFLPLWLSANQKLTNTGDLIKFIIRDEAIHGYAIGYKFQKSFELLSFDRQRELRAWAYDLLDELYENEVKYTRDLYDDHDLTGLVLPFLKYNANKALDNLGFDPLFSTDLDVSQVILKSMNGLNETHDFFSSTGSYVIPKTKAVADEVWAKIEDDDDDDEYEDY